MRNLYFFCGALLLVDGVFGVDETLSVMEGDSVTLKPHPELKQGDSAQWLFDGKRIADMNKAVENVDEKFKGRLNLDQTTGSLNITNIRTVHAGLYKRYVSGTPDRIFNVTVNGASGVNTDGVKSVSVMKGDTVPLFADVKIQEKDQVRLMFRGTCIADLKGPVDSSWSNILVNDKTGDIIDAQSNQTGDYKLEINTSSWSLHRKFHINIRANVESVSGKKGDRITLQTGVTNIQRDEIKLKFGEEDIPIPNLNGPDDTRWKNIYWNVTTGELIISNIRMDQSGNYEVNSTSMILHKKFHITVAADFRRTSCTAAPEIRDSSLDMNRMVWIVIGIGIGGIVIGIGIIIVKCWNRRRRQPRTEIPNMNSLLEPVFQTFV